MNELIRKQDVLNIKFKDGILVQEDGIYIRVDKVVEKINALPTVQTEPLTNNEQRIFLVAMAREEEIGKGIDKRFPEAKEMREYDLTIVCKEIERKVKETLWTN